MYPRGVYHFIQLPGVLINLMDGDMIDTVFFRQWLANKVCSLFHQKVILKKIPKSSVHICVDAISVLKQLKCYDF